MAVPYLVLLPCAVEDAMKGGLDYLEGEGGVYKGWNSQLAQWGAIIPTFQRAPGHFKYIYIIMKTNNLCDIISIHMSL